MTWPMASLSFWLVSRAVKRRASNVSAAGSVMSGSSALSFRLEVTADLLAVLLGHVAALDAPDLAGRRLAERARATHVRGLAGAPGAAAEHHAGHRLRLVDAGGGLRLEAAALDHAGDALVLGGAAALGVAGLRVALVLAVAGAALAGAALAGTLDGDGDRRAAHLSLGV